MFRRRRFLVSCLVLSLAIGIGLVVRNHQRYKHLAIHEPGMMYRSGWLEPDAMSEVIEEYQIRSVVNVCNPGEMGEDRWVGERNAVTNAGARLIEIPMPTSVDTTDPLIGEHIKILADPNNYPMLIHCQHGVTRTSKFLMIYDVVFRNMTVKDSLAAQPLFGREDHNVHVKAFSKTFEKEYKQLHPTMSAEKLKILR